MSFKKNLRGARTYATPSSEEYRRNYERTFRHSSNQPEPLDADITFNGNPNGAEAIRIAIEFVALIAIVGLVLWLFWVNP